MEDKAHLDLDAIEARAKAATPGPWTPDHEYPSNDVKGPDGLWVSFDGGRPHANAEFVAHAREDVPALVEEVRWLRESIREAIRTLKDDPPWPPRSVDIDGAVGVLRDALAAPRSKR